jgi:hypothetical protein
MGIWLHGMCHPVQEDTHSTALSSGYLCLARIFRTLRAQAITQLILTSEAVVPSQCRSNEKDLTTAH